MREITVVYEDGMMDMVEPALLQRLIEDDNIVKFQRAEGWVYPGVDPVRVANKHHYRGPERRHA